MRVLVQKVKKASVLIDSKVYDSIVDGLLLFVGFSNDDNEEIVDQMINKIINLRILEDENGKTNDSILSRPIEVLSVSQFTLYADTRKGRRPSFTKSAKSDYANELYNYFNENLSKQIPVKTGVFQADMDIELVNDGPFTILLDSEEYKWHK